MLYPIFEQAARSVNRQKLLRELLAARVAIVTVVILFCIAGQRRNLFALLGYSHLMLGIVEGALVLGWRLAQWPKNNALELLLVTPLSPRFSMLGEQLVGLTQLAFLSLASVPLLVGMVGAGWLEPIEAAILPIFSFTWACITGLGLTWWAYEPLAVRRWGERITVVVIVIYLLVGGLAGENTFRWLDPLPFRLGARLYDALLFFHYNNPFALVFRIDQRSEEGLLRRVIEVETAALVFAVLFLVRAAFRLKEHYIERHYSPVADVAGKERGTIAERPLAWYAVRRVSEYPGRINLWLAAGTACIYAAYLVGGAYWPAWMGRKLFAAFELLGGVSGMTTVLVVLASVPAAYQYGFWDSTIPERCKRLELLLLTELKARDYLRGSWSPSWYRGRGYFLAAIVLWLAGWWAGHYGFVSLLLAIAAGAALVFFTFAVGFRFLAQSTGSTAVGFLLSLGMPLLTWMLAVTLSAPLARLLPPGMVYYATAGSSPAVMAASVLTLSILAGLILWRGYTSFDVTLRRWYDQNQGKR